MIEALDIVVTVDTSIANLAGAMGRPDCVVLQRAPDWRWGRAGEGSPWFPTLQLFRQSVHGDWSRPVRQVTKVLMAAAAEGRS